MEQIKERKWANNRPIKTRSKMISFRLSLDEMNDLEIEATRRRMSVSDVLRMALEKMLGNGEVQ